MILTLQASTENREPTPNDCTFNEVGGSIGRSGSNTWVLPDNDKYLSGKHAVIDYGNEGYQLTDTSTNGVFVNNSAYALGRGNRILLNEGDVLRMGVYYIKIVLSESPTNDLSSSGDSNDIFKDLDSPAPIATTSRENDLSSSVEADDIFKDLDSPAPIATTSQGEEKSLPLMPEQSVSSNVSSHGELEANWWEPSKSNTDHNNAVSGTDNWWDPSSTGKDNATEDDWWIPKKNMDDANVVNEQDMHVNAQAKPELEKPQSAVVPADNPFPEQEKVRVQNALADIEPETEIVHPTPPLHSIKIEEHASSQPSKPPVSALAQRVANVERLRREGKETSVAITPPVESVKNRAPIKIDEKTSDTTPNAMMQFLKGAGINDPKLQSVIAANLDPEALGRMFQTSVKGTIDILRSRADIKSEMRMDMTTIQPIQNNPLKFSISLEDTLIRLMTTQKEAYMTPERSMAEAYDDIKAHQIAVMAGVQATLSTLLKRFQPDNLTERLEKESPIAASIPFHRQAKLWKHFERLYDAIEQEAEEDFNRLFGAEFAKAYDQQISNLKSRR